MVLLGSAIGCLEGITRGSYFDAKSLEAESLEAEVDDDQGGEERVGPGWGMMSDANRGENEEVETDLTETTPLIGQRRLGWSSAKAEGLGDAEDGSGAPIWWILQLALVVPVPLILVSHIAVVSMGALCQTLADGSSPFIGEVYWSAEGF